MEKEGFIYIWYDCKRKMFYVGCHWGTIDDGYICSSNRMRDAYRRRPHDFKRRIIQRGIERKELLNEEHKWLKLIEEKDYGKKYYNLKFHKTGHWSIDEENKMTVGQKISKRKKGHTPWNKGKKLPSLSKDHRQKIRDGVTRNWKECPRTLSEESRKKLSAANKGKKLTVEHREKISASLLRRNGK